MSVDYIIHRYCIQNISSIAVEIQTDRCLIMWHGEYAFNMVVLIKTYRICNLVNFMIKTMQLYVYPILISKR